MEPIQVFLIEDNPADVLLIRVSLSQVTLPLKLLVAKDGEQALQMLSMPDFQPQLIILDLNMPRVDGQTVLQRCRRTQTPIVIFSSTQNKTEVQKALALGASRIRSETARI
jgi:CheY-like chemotaxis protein